jgi:hypothetical protein
VGIKGACKPFDMSPFEQAAVSYRVEDWQISFIETIEAHAQVGYVIITPEIFLLGRRVMRDCTDEERNDPWVTAVDGDCWHVWMLVGKLQAWHRHLPYSMEWVSMHRRSRLRVRRLASFRRLK